MTRARVNSAVWKVAVGFSLIALLSVAFSVLTGFDQGRPDEGIAAHIWQSSVLLQAACLLLFFVTAEHKRIRRSAQRMGVQATALLLSLAPVALLRL